MPITAAPWLLSEHALHVLDARPRQNTAKPTNAMGIFLPDGNLEPSALAIVKKCDNSLPVGQKRLSAA